MKAASALKGNVSFQEKSSKRGLKVEKYANQFLELALYFFQEKSSKRGLKDGLGYAVYVV